MKNVFSMLEQPSPSWMMYHLMQLTGCPESVGADGPGTVLVADESDVTGGPLVREVYEMDKAGSE